MGAILGLVIGIVFRNFPDGQNLANVVFGAGSTFATMGFVGGTMFSTILGIAEGRRRFDQMSLPRFAGWGAVGGLLLSAYLWITGLDVGGALLVTGLTTLLGAGSDRDPRRTPRPPGRRHSAPAPWPVPAGGRA